jgi:hypothetical protein
MFEASACVRWAGKSATQRVGLCILVEAVCERPYPRTNGRFMPDSWHPLGAGHGLLSLQRSPRKQ